MKKLLIPALMGLLLSCQVLTKAEPEPDGGLAGYNPDGEFAGRADCEKRGGTFSRSGLSGGLVCIETTRDAGKACTAGSQCDGLCLARSGSCSPLKPLFGCHDITDRQRRQGDGLH